RWWFPLDSVQQSWTPSTAIHDASFEQRSNRAARRTRRREPHGTVASSLQLALALGTAPFVRSGAGAAPAPRRSMRAHASRPRGAAVAEGGRMDGRVQSPLRRRPSAPAEARAERT